MDGDSLPVSAFVDCADGQFELGASAYEKRGVAVVVPHWDETKCIQCNQCAYVCPHATIRPFAMTEDEAAAAPEATRTLDAMGPKAKGMKFTMAVSPLDCMGCTNCVKVCPKGALEMVPTEQEMDQQPVWDYMVENVLREEGAHRGQRQGQPVQAAPAWSSPAPAPAAPRPPMPAWSPRSAGDRMYHFQRHRLLLHLGRPRCHRSLHRQGQGRSRVPAWNNSLFEDNAEHGLGMAVGYEAVQKKLIAATQDIIAADGPSDELKAAGQAWIDSVNDTEASKTAAAAYVAELEKCGCDASKAILADKAYLTKKSFWIFGGDGWAYDIGFGGLDHVLASGHNVNVFVFDTEVYSNTGGQASKASNLGQVAQFAAAGKVTKKKSLAEIAMSYGYVYVAQVAMGANPAQTLKAIHEAEAYDGPSLIIGYSPCEMHSIKKGGMQNCQAEMKKAVECGYWNLFRFNPEAAAGKKFSLDSKEPAGGYQEFLMNEARYASLTRSFPERAEELFKENEQAAMDRYAHLLKLKTVYNEA